MVVNRADDPERLQRFQQTHTAKRANERSQELYRTHFNLEHPAERNECNLALAAKRPRNPLIRDMFKSQVKIN